MSASKNVIRAFFRFVFAATILMILSISLCYGSAGGQCIPSESEALLKFKTGLIDPSDKLASWNGELDCCSWYGVVCHNITSHVVEVHLQNIDADQYGDYSERERTTFSGTISESLLELKQLEYLDLSDNNFEGISIPKFIGFLSSLRYLDLSRAGFGGLIPCQLGNLSNLQYLIIQPRSQFNGLYLEKFDWVSRLSSLKFLDLSSVNLSIAFDRKETLGKLPFLLHLVLSNCLLTQFPSTVVNLTSLHTLDLSENMIDGPLPVHLGEMTSLTSLDLSYNNVNGNIPVSFGSLAKLENFDASFNSLEGEISEIHFENLTNLRRFDASENQLILRVDPDWVPQFQLVEKLYLRSWDVGPQFPTWLRSLPHLQYLDFSNSGISSTLPTWFHNFSSTLYEINLSHNRMHGMFHNLSNADSGSSYIDLSSNYFSDPLPSVSSISGGIDLSNNLFYGTMHNFLCNYEMQKHKAGNLSTIVLMLNKNLLSGEMPDCLMNWTSLIVLDLSNNNFSGDIPTSIGSLGDLQMLNLHNNNLIGDIPSSIRHCSGLSVLNLGENVLGGEIPSWIAEHLVYLNILSFRGNKFHGHIPEEICDLKYLNTFDVSDNNLNGTIPTCIGNMWGLIGRTSYQLEPFNLSNNSSLEYYIRRSTIMRKMKVEFSTILSFLGFLDLSNNKLVGEIPDGITSLPNLLSLNLSHNLLGGRIPEDIGAMQKLEALDLSQNQLFGEIPESMSSNMPFLTILNLSNNRLSGKIPQGYQFQTFDSSSYFGNKLCGPPVNHCIADGDDPTPNGKEEAYDDEHGVDSLHFCLSFVMGFVVGFWCLVGPLALRRRWRHSYFKFLETLWDKIWVWFHVNVVRFLRGRD
ncbi:Receptor-like protein EIX1 [Euphorbia peplus]|nr:Receptor-like protein EIX1 [Euphorbia peplus]